MEELSIKSEGKDGAMIVTITGRVDSVTAGTLDKELEKIMHADKKVVLDLKEITYLSSAGVRVIVKMLRNEQKAGGNVKLACIPHMVEEVLETVGMTELLKTYPTVEEAIASF